MQRYRTRSLNYLKKELGREQRHITLWVNFRTCYKIIASNLKFTNPRQ
jgi:hypothetical protein